MDKYSIFSEQRGVVLFHCFIGDIQGIIGNQWMLGEIINEGK